MINTPASNGLQELKYLKLRQWEVNLWVKHLERSYENARFGYACENIAFNFKSPEELFYQWKNSPPHRRNMLLPKIKYCAVGVHKYRRAYFGVFRGYYDKSVK